MRTLIQTNTLKAGLTETILIDEVVNLRDKEMWSENHLEPSNHKEMWSENQKDGQEKQDT